MFSFNWLLYGACGIYALCALLFRLNKKGPAAALLAAGFMAHTVFLGSRCFIAGVFLFNGFTESVFLLPWAITAALLVMLVTVREDIRWEGAAALAVLFTLFSIIYPDGIIPPTPSKIGPWTYAFFFSESLGHACLYLSAWAAMEALRKRASSGLFHRLILWGFILYTSAQIIGAVWAYLGWTTTFRWGSRHLQSAVIWCYYAAYLHLRYAGWNERRKALFAMGGFVVVMLCSFGSYINEMRFPRIGG
jgi:ABC-type transport system involved in cytochrome c biogenesis permease subunit